jgi:hypothetical protein
MPVRVRPSQSILYEQGFVSTTGGIVVDITARHMEGGQGHEHIASVRWINPETNDTGETSRAGMVDWIQNKNGKAYVVSGGYRVAVGVVNAAVPYIRTYADGVWTDNLLALPTF